MKIIQFAILFIVNALVAIAQPNFSLENNCFEHFNPNARGRNDMNQYLLAELNRLIYPERLGTDLGTNRYVRDEGFQSAYIQRTQHWFYNPATEPKRPAFSVAVWNNLERSCYRAKHISDADWRTLEGACYEATDTPKPSNQITTTNSTL